MISTLEYELAVKKALYYFEKAGIVLTEYEKKNIEVADFGLNDLKSTGLQLVTYINTQRVCSKELVLFPRQTCPEHRHPDRTSTVPGKEETFRCRYGRIYLYVEGYKSKNPYCTPPAGSEKYYSAWKEIVLNPGEQYTLRPNTLHWFQAGEDGAIVSEFSTNSDDFSDIFTDDRIRRIPEVAK